MVSKVLIAAALLSTAGATTMYDCTPPVDGWSKEKADHCCLTTLVGCSAQCYELPWVQETCPSQEYLNLYLYYKHTQLTTPPFQYTVQTQRAVFQAFKQLVPPIAEEVRTIGGVVCEVFGVSSGTEVASKRTIIHIHGGGYIAGDTQVTSGYTAALAKATGQTVVSVNYTLAPEMPMPGQVNQIMNVYNALLAEGKRPKDISFSGDSAGGGMVLLTLQRIRDLVKGKKSQMPACAVLLSPWSDLANTGDSMQTKALVDPLVTYDSLLFTSRAAVGDININNERVGTSDLTNPLVSPFYGNFRRLPPLYFDVGSNEILLDDVKRTASRALAAGVRVRLNIAPSMVHIYQTCIGANCFPEAEYAIGRLANFINRWS